MREVYCEVVGKSIGFFKNKIIKFNSIKDLLVKINHYKTKDNLAILFNK